MAPFCRCITLALAASAALVSARPASAATNSDFITQAYHDLLNRLPSPAEVTQYLTFLNSHTRQQTALDIETGAEFRGIVVQNFYSALLHRIATPSEQTAAVGLIVSGSTFEQVQAPLAGSAEYFSTRAGSTNTGFLDALFPDFLNRPPSPTDLSVFGTQLTSGSTRTDVATELLTSTEYQTDLVNSWFSTYLHRQPLSSERSLYVSQLQSSVRDETVISELLGSDEYLNNIPIPEPVSLCFLALPAFLLRPRRRRM